jgi:hypothetical protein
MNTVGCALCVKWCALWAFNICYMFGAASARQGVEVTLVDANHCPGAVLLLFRLPDGRRIIHTGDMRYCPGMKENQHLEGFRGADAVFLDTTYCSPKYTFPAQVSSGLVVKLLTLKYERYVLLGRAAVHQQWAVRS